MSDERRENKNEELTAFEAALRSLRPRADRLDPSWRAELAKQAALGPRSFGERAGSKGPASAAHPAARIPPAIGTFAFIAAMTRPSRAAAVAGSGRRPSRQRPPSQPSC